MYGCMPNPVAGAGNRTAKAVHVWLHGFDSRLPGKQHRVHGYTRPCKLYTPGINMQQRKGGNGVFSLRGLGLVVRLV